MRCCRRDFGPSGGRAGPRSSASSVRPWSPSTSKALRVGPYQRRKKETSSSGVVNRQVQVRCKDDPGYDVDLAVEAGTGQMQRWLVGLAPFRDLVASGAARMLGPSRLARAFPTWFGTSHFAESLRRARHHDRPDAIPA